jgi:hypothetical protein
MGSQSDRQGESREGESLMVIIDNASEAEIIARFHCEPPRCGVIEPTPELTLWRDCLDSDTKGG